MFCFHFACSKSGLQFTIQLNPNLDTDTAVVFGHGNVALDVARLLLSPLDMIRVSNENYFRRGERAKVLTWKHSLLKLFGHLFWQSLSPIFVFSQRETM